MILNSWKARLIYGLVLWLANTGHHEIVSIVSNTPTGMLVYHGTAALADLILLACAPTVLHGKLADDMQKLCLLSIGTNAIGWFMYLAYIPPNFYNSAIGILGYVQFARLLTMGLYGTDRVGGTLFHGHVIGRTKLHYQKA